MATLLDTSLLDFFTPLFVFLLVFAGALALLQKTKLFGDGETKTLNLIAAISIAAVTVFIGDTTTRLVTAVVPWIIFIFLVMLLLFGLYMFFGTSEEKVWDIIGQTPIFIIVLIIILIGLSAVFQKELSPYEDSGLTNESSKDTLVLLEDVNGQPYAVERTPRSEALKSLTHPRLLGALFMLIIAAAALKLIVDKID